MRLALELIGVIVVMFAWVLVGPVVATALFAALPEIAAQRLYRAWKRWRAKE